MTPFDALLNMSQLTLRARGEWQRSATGHADIERAVSDCAELLRRDDMPDLVTLAQIEAAITELKLRCGWQPDNFSPANVTHCCAGIGYGNSPDLKAGPAEPYDYARDDQNFDAAREDRIFGKGR